MPEPSAGSSLMSPHPLTVSPAPTLGIVLANEIGAIASVPFCDGEPVKSGGSTVISATSWTFVLGS